MTQKSSPKCLEVTRGDINIFFQSSGPFSFSFHVIECGLLLWQGLQPWHWQHNALQCHSAHILSSWGWEPGSRWTGPSQSLQTWGNPFLGRVHPASSEESVWASRSERKPFSLPQSRVFTSSGNATSTRGLSVVSFGRCFPRPTHHQVLATLQARIRLSISSLLTLGKATIISRLHDHFSSSSPTQFALHGLKVFSFKAIQIIPLPCLKPARSIPSYLGWPSDDWLCSSGTWSPTTLEFAFPPKGPHTGLV